VNGFVKAGTKVPYDLTKAQVDLGTARLNEIKARDAQRIAEATLANAMGLAEVVDWTPAAGLPMAPFTLTFDEAWEEARKNQPALAAASARVDGASALVDAQIAALYPSITASAGYSASGTTFPLTWNWQLGPNLNWILFNGFQNYYQIDEAAANLRAARAERAATEQSVWLEVRTAYVSLEDAKERLDLTELTARQATENLALAQGRYQVGKATAVDLTDAQVALAQARSDHVQARADYDTAIAQLWKSLGVTAWTH
jgi:outer membrane protein TolC